MLLAVIDGVTLGHFVNFSIKNERFEFSKLTIFRGIFPSSPHSAKYKPISLQIMLIGRKKEQEILLNAINSGEPEMIAVIGRRRVGKTFLVRTVCSERIRFEVAGVQDATLKEQLGNFHFQMKKTFEGFAPGF